MNIVISISSQSLKLLTLDQVAIFTAKISSGKNGVGFLEGSGKTPLGHFSIAEKIGEGLPINTIFQGRKATGLYPENIPNNTVHSADLILTRILRLSGLDEENANTWDRYIYIHATQQRELLGRPASHGCIRLAPEDMLTLYDLVSIGDSCIIEE